MTRALDKSSGPDYAPVEAPSSVTRTAARPKKRFGILSALVRFAIALAVLGAAGYQTWSWIAERPEAPRRINRERTFTVNAIAPAYDTFRADVATFGQVVASRTIDLRAQVQGRIIAVSPDFAVGNAVVAGDVLVEIDPYAYDGALIEAQAQLANAELALAEARQAYALEEGNIEAARTALTAAQTDLDRARSLLASGSVTQQTVDTRALTVSERQQALSQREANLFTLQAQIMRQSAAVEQARWQIDTARRNLENTVIAAPFSGVVTAAGVTEGGHVNVNEVVGALYDTAALDVAFTVSDRQYGQLSAVGLAGRPVTVTWDLGAAPVVAAGTISRTAAQVDAGTGGVSLYARLEAADAERLRPGTFVAVTIEGIAYENALRVPETAVYDDDHLYVIREGRMAAIPLAILARDNDHLIVSATIPEGERIVTSRLSQAGEGVAVMVEGEEQAVPTMTGGPGAGGPGGGAVVRGPGGN